MMMMKRRFFGTLALFGSDNVAGCDARVWQRVAQEYGNAESQAQSQTRSAYGKDELSGRVKKRIGELVRIDANERVDVHLVYNGTAANIVGLACVMRPYDAVLVSETSHIYTAECGAVERFVGARCVPVATRSDERAQLRRDAVLAALQWCGSLSDMHSVRPRVLSITQANEYGAVYGHAQLGALRELCDEHQLLLHVDGARISNAAASLSCSFADVLRHADLASFGMSKNGALCGEAVVLFRDRLLRRGVAAADLDQAERVRKQAMQLHSKMPFIAAQFDAFLADDVWRANAAHANAMAQRLARGLAERAPAMRVSRRVDSNAVFVRFPHANALAELQRHYAIGEWEPPHDEVRLMCSYATTPEQVDTLVERCRAATAVR
jgi:threonine aldolase